MIKKAVIILIIIFSCSIAVNAEEISLEQQFIENYGTTLDESVTNEAKDFFDENNISMEDPTAFTNLSIKDVFFYIIENIKSNLGKPIKLLGLLIGIILLIAIVENLSSSNQNSSLAKIVDIVGVLVCLGIIFNYIAECINITASTLYDGSNFMMFYVPVFAGVIGAGGSLTSASVYNIGVLLVAEVAVQIATKFLLPLMGLMFAMSIIETINPGISLNGITNAVKKTIQWILGLVMTLFVAMITIQSIVGTSADSVGVRTAKFMASSFIPVIGGAISDAYSTLKGSLGVLRSGVGTLGIVVLLLTIVPPLISVGVIQLSLSVGSFVGELMGIKKVSALLKNTAGVLSIAISLLACFAVMLIVSTTIMMMLGLNIN